MATLQEGDVEIELFPQLTVTEDYNQRREIKKGSASICYGVAKWVVTVIVCFALLFCMVASKLSVIVISQDLTEGNGTERQFQAHLDVDSRLSLLMLLLIFLVPYVVTFLWCLWSSGVLYTMAGWLLCRCLVPHFEEKSTDIDFKPWPKKCAIVMGGVASVLEVGGLWFLVTAVYTHATGITSVAMGTLAFTAYNTWYMIKTRAHCCQQTSRPKKVVAFLVFFFNFGGLLAATIYSFLDSTNTLFGRLGNLSWTILISVACFSFAWCPEILQYQLKMFSADKTTNKSVANPTRWKAGLLTSMEKIVLTPLTLYWLGLYYSHDDVFIRAIYENQGWAWVTGLREHRLFWYFILNILTSFSSYVLMWLATALDIGFKVKKRYISMASVPMVLATPLSAIVVVVYPACDALLPDYQCDHLGAESSAVSVALLVFLYVANFMSVGVWLAMNEAPKISKETRLFWLPTYNGILIEQWLWLNRRTEKNDPNHRSTLKQRKECTIFICTTMYNESEEEMRQLLTSIKNVLDHRDENSPSYHSHIWLDGAFDTKRKKSKHLNANALRLLALIRSVFGVEFECRSNQAREIGFERHDAPYGLQLKWTFKDSQRGEPMDVVLHLKDNRKVKAKKRWSQIMYLSYIVDFLKNKPQNSSASNKEWSSRCKNWEKDLKKTFILATDADVKFTLDSVEALFDVFLRDDENSVSAVCGRTHPLKFAAILPQFCYNIAANLRTNLQN